MHHPLWPVRRGRNWNRQTNWCVSKSFEWLRPTWGRNPAWFLPKCTLKKKKGISAFITDVLKLFSKPTVSKLTCRCHQSMICYHPVGLEILWRIQSSAAGSLQSSLLTCWISSSLVPPGGCCPTHERAQAIVSLWHILFTFFLSFFIYWVFFCLSEAKFSVPKCYCKWTKSSHRFLLSRCLVVRLWWMLWRLQWLLFSCILYVN